MKSVIFCAQSGMHGPARGQALLDDLRLPNLRLPSSSDLRLPSSVSAAAARAFQKVAGDAIGEDVATAVSEWRRALGVAARSEAVCDLYAAPFVHGPALEAEARRLDTALSRFPEQAQVRQAHEQLHTIELELPSVSAALMAVSAPELPGDFGAGVRAIVSTRLAREADLDARRERDVAQVKAQAEEGRQAFKENLRRARGSRPD